MPFLTLDQTGITNMVASLFRRGVLIPVLVIPFATTVVKDAPLIFFRSKPDLRVTRYGNVRQNSYQQRSRGGSNWDPKQGN